MKFGEIQSHTLNYTNNVCTRRQCKGIAEISIDVLPVKGRILQQNRISKFSGCISCELCGVKITQATDGNGILRIDNKITEFIHDADQLLIMSRAETDSSGFAARVGLPSNLAAAAVKYGHLPTPVQPTPHNQS